MGLVSGEHKIIRFDEFKARSQCVVRAKKLGVKLLFAEQAGKLYVKLAESDGPAMTILSILRGGPRTKAEIVKELTARGMIDVNPGEELKKLSANGLAQLGSDSKWSATKQ